MAHKKKILIVDDHFEMLDFLRSMLQLSNPDFEVSAVPSGEEGLLELHGSRFDLLISDVRLPGISGFELVRKARRLQADLPMLMITGYASAQGRKEAEQLGVLRYFQKPLDTDALLAAIHAALHESPAPATRRGDTKPLGRAPQAVAAESEPEAAEGLPAGDVEAPAAQTAARLQALLSDTGAVDVLLAQADGQIVQRAGGSSQPADHLARLLARSLQDSFELAQALGSAEPLTIQYQSGATTDVYAANVGRAHFLIMLFDAAARRGRIGTVWVFAQRAVKELRELLDEPGAPAAAAPAEEPPAETPPPPAEQAAEGQEHDALFHLLQQSDGGEHVDLDGYWEEAAADAPQGGPGLSYDEALRQGLLPPDLY